MWESLAGLQQSLAVIATGLILGTAFFIGAALGYQRGYNDGSNEGLEELERAIKRANNENP